MPRADPEAARETAVKHLFRHLGDEQQLLRNPLVGPELLSGSITAKELRARVARAATIIRDEDANLGRMERGERQSACLLRCDLGSQSVASLAGEFAISPRQLARERHEAWMRTIQHVLTKTAHLTPASLDDIVHNRALALFRSGRERDGARIMQDHIARSVPEAALFGLCSLALMQHDFKRTRDAEETYRDLMRRVPSTVPIRTRARLNLALCLLSVLLGRASATVSWSAQVGDLARRAALEAPAVPWMSRTLLRLFLSISQHFVIVSDYRNMLVVCVAIDEIVPSYENLDGHEELSLHALKAISEWKQNGFNVEMEAHLLRALHLAISNGLTGVIAEGASLLASIYYVNGEIVAARSYRDMALSAVVLTDDKGSIALTYSNLAAAALDSDCLDAAAHFNDFCIGPRAEHPLLEHIPLVAAEILVRQGQMTQGIAQAREVLQGASLSGNQRLAAIAGRVVAIGLEAVGDGGGAAALMRQSLDLAAGYCSKYDANRIERSYHKLAHPKRFAPIRQLTYRNFFG